MTRLLSWLTGSTGPILGLFFALLACAATGVIGYNAGHQAAAAQGRADLLSLQRDHDAAVLSATQAAYARYEGEVQYGLRLARQLVDEREAHASEKRELQEQIKNVTTVYVPAEGMAPIDLPRCVFTNGFVREYNAALGLSANRASPPAIGTAATPSATPALGARLHESGVSQADILAHIADYGQRCRGIESQLNRVLDLTAGDR